MGKRRRLGGADRAGGAAQKKLRSVCPHQRQRSKCKECGGASICTAAVAPSPLIRCSCTLLSLVHPITAGAGEERAASAEPAAAGVGKRWRLGQADTAGGAAQKKPRSVCPHQRRRCQCKECGGASICQHQRTRSTCKECGGASFWQHQRRRSDCKECGGASICPHQRRRSDCKECGGGENLPAPTHQERMQGVRGGEHLPAPAHQEPMQGVPSANYRW